VSWITVLSDYGYEDSYVGVCRGVIGRIAPDARVIDVCHQIPPRDVAQGALILAEAVAYLPVGIHLALVDPVGPHEVRPVVVETSDGSRFVAPDNGLSSGAWDQVGGVARAFEITNTELMLPRPSPLFRGRDVFAPVAAHLAAGMDLPLVGTQVDPGSLVRLSEAVATVHGDHVHGEVVGVDHFGNLALNMRRSDLEAAGLTLGDPVQVRAGGRTYEVPLVHSYGEVARGRLAVCENADRRITVAVNLGNAAATLRGARGDALVLGRVPPPLSWPGSDRRIGVLDPPPGPGR
jgi:hypothetical protein